MVYYLHNIMEFKFDELSEFNCRSIVEYGSFLRPNLYL